MRPVHILLREDVAFCRGVRGRAGQGHSTAVLTAQVGRLRSLFDPADCLSCVGLWVAAGAYTVLNLYHMTLF